MPSVIESQWMSEIARRTAVWHGDGVGAPDGKDAPPEPLRVYDYKGLRWHREDAERQKVGKQSKRTQAQVCAARSSPPQSACCHLTAMTSTASCAAPCPAQKPYRHDAHSFAGDCNCDHRLIWTTRRLHSP